MGDLLSLNIDTEIDELRNKLNTLMCNDYKSIYDEVLTISMQLDKLINLIQPKS
jgi:hypothetical protein